MGFPFIQICVPSLKQICSDVNHRIAFWSQMKDIGFEPPPREQLTKSEMVEEERLQNAIEEAGRASSIADLAKPLRSAKARIPFSNLTLFSPCFL